jgi:type II secretory pathway component PulJ
MQDGGVKNMSSQEQLLQQAQKKIAELQQRETELRKELKAARKEHKKELGDVRQRFDQEKSALVQKVCMLSFPKCLLCRILLRYCI